MASLRGVSDIGGSAIAAIFTTGESSFRNAKLRDAGYVAYKIFADIVGKGSLFLLTLVAARRLSPRAFGLVALGSTVGWLLSIASDFGMQMHLARAVARTPDRAAPLLRHWLRLRLATSAASLVVVALALSVWNAASPFARPLLLFAVLYACNGLVEFLNYFYRGLSRTDVESSITLWHKIATLVVAGAALAWRPDITVLAVAMLAPAAAAFVWSLRYATRLAATGAVASRSRQPEPDPAVFARDVFPIGLGILLSALYFRVDVLLVEWWAGTEAVARYNAVFRLVEALRLFPAAVLAVVLPALCRADDLGPLIRVSAIVTVAATGASAILWAAAAPVVRLAYGEPYDSAVPAFRILALSLPLLSLNFALTHQLVAWNRQRAYAAICALALVVNVALNARLIPAFSIDGAAWATFGTELFLTLGCVVALR